MDKVSGSLSFPHDPTIFFQITRERVHTVLSPCQPFRSTFLNFRDRGEEGGGDRLGMTGLGDGIPLRWIHHASSGVSLRADRIWGTGEVGRSDVVQSFFSRDLGTLFGTLHEGEFGVCTWLSSQWHCAHVECQFFIQLSSIPLLPKQVVRNIGPRRGARMLKTQGI